MSENELTWLKDFQPPKNQVELLERSLDFARNEQRWCTGALIQSPSGGGPNSVNEQYGDKDDYELCTNVQACAMGILVIATGNGDAIRHWIKAEGTEENVFDYVRGRVGPIFEQATKTLACAFNGSRRLSFVRAVDRVESANDNDSLYVIEEEVAAKYDRKAHHADIVKGFEKAVELAKEQADEHQ